ncbi:hypothetical protein DFH07DRAFT_736526 [Mycena maculata]|uniref:Uncharacterized protein n=1 Tax=Mycena maculata TaxID=230809 RepID=A0AAD7JRC2_9AGAR|nr:hypothetical protein DFH07DRAFT_736526 [Mycena maculata]
MTHATPFSEALDVIYETIGCDGATVKKPAISHRLSNATQKSVPINLTSEEDWQGCQEDVREAEDKKKGAKITVSIIVSLQVRLIHSLRSFQYLASLRVKLGVTGAGKAGKSKKIVIMDLEHAGSGDDDFDEGVGILVKEGKHLEQLQNQYGHCQRCGTSKSCKIDMAGNHHHLTNGQLSAWSRTLAAGTHNVTLKTPPQADLFSMFFKKFGGGAPPPAAEPLNPAFGNMGPFMGMNPYAYMPWGAPFGAPANFGGLSSHQPHTPMTPTPIAGPSARSTPALLPAFPSSDPPDIGAINPYPEIAEFFRELDGYDPKRRLLDAVSNFEKLDYYNIDEIANIGKASEIAQIVGITIGNATHILGHVKAEMKRIDRERRATA